MSASAPSNAPRRVHFEIQLVGLSVLLLLTLGALLSALAFARLEEAARGAIGATFVETSQKIVQDLDESRRLLRGSLLVTAAAPVASDRSFAARRRHVATLVTLLGLSGAVVAAYVGYPDGSYFYVRRVANGGPSDDRAPPGSRYLVRDLDRSTGTLRAQRYFLDAQLRPSSALADGADPVDPRVRPWFVNANAQQMMMSDPYALGSSHQLGYTLSMRGAAGSVAAVSLGLTGLSAVLERSLPAPGSLAALLEADGHVLALSRPKRLTAAIRRAKTGLPTVADVGSPQLTAALAAARTRAAGTVHVAPFATAEYRVTALPPIFGPGRRLMLMIPEAALDASYRTIRNYTSLLSGLIMFGGVLAAWWMGRSIARPIVRMTHAAAALEQLDFSAHPIPVSGVREIDALAATFDAMRGRLLQFTELSAALASGQDLRALLDRTLREIVASLGADAGVAYIAHAGRLSPIAACGLSASPHQDPPPGGLAVHAANVREPLQFQVDADDPTLGDAFAALGEDTALRILALPFVSHDGDLVALVLAARRRNPAQPFSESAVTYGRSFAGSTALALEAQRYLDDLERYNDAAACFVPTAFLEQLECSDISAMRLGHFRRQEMTVLSSDIRSFTTISEELGVERTFEFLTAYLSRVGPCVRDAGGFIDRYVGDAIIALFPRSAADAVDAAICLQAAVRAFNADRPPWLRRIVAAGAGIDAGEFTLGTIGETERYATAAISPAVARAETIESRTVFFGAPVLIGERVAAGLEPGRFLRRMPLVGPDDGEAALQLFEVVDADDGALRAQKLARADDFAAAVGLLEAGRFAAAAGAFEAIVREVPEDLPATRLRDYCRTFG